MVYVMLPKSFWIIITPNYIVIHPYFLLALFLVFPVLYPNLNSTSYQLCNLGQDRSPGTAHTSPSRERSLGPSLWAQAHPWASVSPSVKWVEEWWPPPGLLWGFKSLYTRPELREPGTLCLLGESQGYTPQLSASPVWVCPPLSESLSPSLWVSVLLSLGPSPPVCLSPLLLGLWHTTIPQ